MGYMDSDRHPLPGEQSEYSYSLIRILLPVIVVFYLAAAICYALGIGTIWTIETVFGK
jgi:hypothetical protein